MTYYSHPSRCQVNLNVRKKVKSWTHRIRSYLIYLRRLRRWDLLCQSSSRTPSWWYLSVTTHRYVPLGQHCLLRLQRHLGCLLHWTCSGSGAALQSRAWTIICWCEMDHRVMLHTSCVVALPQWFRSPSSSARFSAHLYRFLHCHPYQKLEKLHCTSLLPWHQGRSYSQTWFAKRSIGWHCPIVDYSK